MDEIIIEEKKYVSSKQAAKMTGYAKDYVGQLCREGRVPARLVGRSWYVLESAIQDHRFGGDEAAESRSVQSAPGLSLTHTWESARYESSDAAETLPSLNRLEKAGAATDREKGAERDATELTDLHDSWKAWFDHVGDAPVPVAEEPAQPVAEAVVAIEEPVVEEEKEVVDEEVSVPLHVVAPKRPLRELLPLEKVAENKEEPVWEEHEEGRSVSISSIAHAAMMLVVIISVTLAASGSGYLDGFFVSHSRASALSGISVVNK